MKTPQPPPLPPGVVPGPDNATALSRYAMAMGVQTWEDPPTGYRNARAVAPSRNQHPSLCTDYYPVYDRRPRRALFAVYILLPAIVLVLLLNVGLTLYVHQQMRAGVQGLQQSLGTQGQSTAEMLIAEIRGELRAMPDQQVQSLQQLTVEMAARDEAFREQLAADLTAQLSRAREQFDTLRDADNERRSATADVIRGLQELKADITALRERGAPPAFSNGPLVSSATAVTEPVSTETAETAQQLSSPLGAVSRPTTIFFVDASGGLRHELAQVFRELQRSLPAVPESHKARVVIHFEQQLLEIDPAVLATGRFNCSAGWTLNASGGGPADLGGALKLLINTRPSVLNILSDTLGDVEAMTRVLDQAKASGTSVHLTQFFSRTNREELKAIAREHHGTYTFVSR